MKGAEILSELNALPDCRETCRKPEIIRGTGAVLLGYAKDLEDARINSQTLPKIAFATKPVDYTAANTPGTIVSEIASESLGIQKTRELHIGHSWGMMYAKA